MHLPESVMIDLLPSYFAGESSAATRALVDAYFDAHPAFAQAMRATQGARLDLPKIAVHDHGQEAIRRVRKSLQWRAVLMALAVCCSVAPFTVILKDQSVVYFMWRDAPAASLIYTGIAAGLWGLVWRSQRANPAQ